MLSTDLKQGHAYTFDVIKEHSTRKFFRVKTDDGVNFSLLKFKFQQNQPLPDSIRCYVKSLYPLSLGQDISVFINDFYTEGKEYNFKIKATKNSDVLIYELEDAYDLCFRLYNAPDSLSVGSTIKCQIVKIRGVNVSLKYVGTLSTKLPLDFLDLSQWLSLLGIEKGHDHFLNLIESIPAFQTALIKYDEGNADWIFELLKATSTHLPDWLIACKDDRKLLAKTIHRMALVRKLALIIIEESDYLRNCNGEQRAMLQSNLSEYVELFDQYEQAAAKILNKTYEDFIDKMFRRLKRSGYLYKPSRQFRIMMTILKLRPELINTRMSELFEALHNWELSNWLTEPFRAALVQSLQIFIRENCKQINTLPSNDSGEDNKAIIRMVMAIAVQSMLANDNDTVDLTINRAMLYRYISFLKPENVNLLLNKCADSILGTDNPSEFSWNDTEHPNLLMEKLSHPFPYSEDRINLVKKYSTSKASVLLKADGLQIIAANADPDSTSLPNNTIDFLNPRISLNDEIKTGNLRKSKDLKTFTNLWDDIRWSIFGEELSAGVKVEKKIPFPGEEVKVIIDDVKIFPDAPEKQRLQFHCTIYDDLYYGEGWMPCDTYHLVGWLSARDYPGNYDGSLAFAQDTNGTPLLFNATVSNHYDKLVFSMKSQIEDFLLESTWNGEESICMVTHLDRHNNAWLCLSEKGNTFKVNIDESSAHLSEGMLVRIKCLEPDRLNMSSTMIFLGELSENQENIPPAIKKSSCLLNLMHGLGELPEDSINNNSEVVEVEEVMTLEELLEIIYMLQRRAFSETEYIKAYNYLGLASVLCRIAEESKLEREISTHMELLELLQDFGKNQRIDSEWLADCEKKASEAPMLERIYTRLKIVAEIDNHNNAEWLWHIQRNPRNDTEKRLASLVLSYNMIPEELDKTKKDILKEITTLLNVNNTAPTSKYYGDESQTVEFKSSLIFPAGKSGKPDYKAQLHEIVHTICGFMNARGGNIYIGVNDSGYENGLADDLAYRKAHSLKPTIDSMIVELQNHLDRIMPPHAKDHWEIESDPDSKKGVIVVKVLPVEVPVEYEGIIYVRSSSSTKPRLDEQRDEFIKNRAHNYNLLMKIWGVEKEETGNQPSPVLSLSESSEKPDNSLKATFEESVVSFSDNNSAGSSDDYIESDSTSSLKISTGRHRLNVLHNYEPNFVIPILYLYFMSDNSIKCAQEDAFTDYEDNCRLALAVKEKEKDSFLILTYSDGRIVKYPLGDFSNFMKNGSRSIRKGLNLLHANIGGAEDYLLTVFQTSTSSLIYRIDSISSLNSASRLDENGDALSDHSLRIMAQEIITPDKLPFFNSDSVDRESKFAGMSLPYADGHLSVADRISNFLKPVAHTE